MSTMVSPVEIKLKCIFLIYVTQNGSEYVFVYQRVQFKSQVRYGKKKQPIADDYDVGYLLCDAELTSITVQ